MIELGLIGRTDKFSSASSGCNGFCSQGKIFSLSGLVAQGIERLRPKEGVGSSILSEGILFVNGFLLWGEMSEWSMVRLSKSREPKGSVGSNPTLSVTKKPLSTFTSSVGFWFS